MKGQSLLRFTAMMLLATSVLSVPISDKHKVSTVAYQIEDEKSFQGIGNEQDEPQGGKPSKQQPEFSDDSELLDNNNDFSDGSPTNQLDSSLDNSNPFQLPSNGLNTPNRPGCAPPLSQAPVNNPGSPPNENSLDSFGPPSNGPNIPNNSYRGPPLDQAPVNSLGSPSNEDYSSSSELLSNRPNISDKSGCALPLNQAPLNNPGSLPNKGYSGSPKLPSNRRDPINKFDRSQWVGQFSTNN